MSMRLVTDPRFALRVEDYHAFYDYVNNCKDLTSDDPKKALETIAEQVNEINNKLQKAAIPYGRGGDEKNEWYSDMVSNWNTLYSTFMLPFIYTVRNELRKFDSYIKDDDSDVVTSLDEIQNQAIQKIHYFFTSVYLDCALTVAALSWFGMDVSPQWLGAIQSMMPLNMMGGGGGETLTSSGGRTSEDHMQKPDYSPAPRRLPNKA
jgi:hypothetical protein